MSFLDFEQIDLSDSEVHDATEFTIPDEAHAAMLQADSDGAIRYTMVEGKEPTSTSGMLLRNTTEPEKFLIEDLEKIKFLRQTTVTRLNIHYFK